MRTQALAALHQCGYRADVATRPLLEAELQAEIAHTIWLLTHLVGVGDPKQAPLRLLHNELRAALTQQPARLLLWLALLYDPAILQRVRTALALTPGLRRTPTAEQRAYALETLDLLLPKAVSKQLLVFLDDLPPAQQIKQVVGELAQAPLALPRQIAAIILGDERWVTPWLRAIALYAVAHMLPTVQAGAMLRGAVLGAATTVTADPLVQETAAWVMTELNDTTLNIPSGAGLHTPRTLLTLEKVLILQRVEIFATMPATLLVEIAARLRELFVPADAIIFAKGAPGDSLYLIAAGTVEALDGERVFTHMGEGEIFGEMALLDGEPRTATIRATQPTQLLCLDQAPFYELMDEHIEIARGVIHVLLQRLRARTTHLNRLQAQLAGNTDKVKG